MDLTKEEMQEIRKIAADIVLPPLSTFILKGERDKSLVVTTVARGFIAGKAAR